jgi:hypothetical protein
LIDVGDASRRHGHGMREGSTSEGRRSYTEEHTPGWW